MLNPIPSDDFKMNLEGLEKEAKKISRKKKFKRLINNGWDLCDSISQGLTYIASVYIVIHFIIKFW